MKPFRFKKFEIKQSSKVFRVGTDGVLLGALASVTQSKNALEVGVGTGLISLMLAQRNSKLNIKGIDINPLAALLAKENFEASSYSSRLSVEKIDFKELSKRGSYDLIVSNPPYFLPNHSSKDKIARQTLHLNFPELIEGVGRHLSSHGTFSVIIPSQFKDEFAEYAVRVGLFLSRMVSIRGTHSGPVVRVILEFKFGKQDLINESLTIEEKPRVYSKEYLELTKEFHLFNRD